MNAESVATIQWVFDANSPVPGYDSRDSFPAWEMRLAAMDPDNEAPLDSTIELLRRYRDGESASLHKLLERHLPPLRRWARGRLPGWARDLTQTDDLVQDVLLHAVESLKSFQPQFDGALRSYLRRAVLNRIKDEQARVVLRPARDELSGQEPDSAPTAFQQAVGAELQNRYEAALARLKPDDRELVIARVEFSCTYAEIAADLGKPSVDAARVAVGRALVRLAQQMDHEV